MLRESAQSIPRLEKPKNRRFSHKNPKMFDFRFNTLIPSLNQGRESVFKVRECAQSISRLKNLRIDGFLIKIRKCQFVQKKLVKKSSLQKYIPSRLKTQYILNF